MNVRGDCLVFVCSFDMPAPPELNKDLQLLKVLNDQNYAQWSRSVLIALSSKLKLGFIDGSQVKPADSSPHAILWKRSNDLKREGPRDRSKKPIRRGGLMEDKGFLSAVRMTQTRICGVKAWANLKTLTVVIVADTSDRF
ncbi:hypothetical protein ACET3Z_018582 [Daucus carota]